MSIGRVHHIVNRAAESCTRAARPVDAARGPFFAPARADRVVVRAGEHLVPKDDRIPATVRSMSSGRVSG
jgi:hypothetical protein